MESSNFGFTSFSATATAYSEEAAHYNMCDILLISCKVTGVFGSSCCIDSADPVLFKMGISNSRRVPILRWYKKGYGNV